MQGSFAGCWCDNWVQIFIVLFGIEMFSWVTLNWCWMKLSLLCWGWTPECALSFWFWGHHPVLYQDKPWGHTKGQHFVIWSFSVPKFRCSSIWKHWVLKLLLFGTPWKSLGATRVFLSAGESRKICAKGEYALGILEAWDVLYKLWGITGCSIWLILSITYGILFYATDPPRMGSALPLPRGDSGFQLMWGPWVLFLECHWQPRGCRICHVHNGFMRFHCQEKYNCLKL